MMFSQKKVVDNAPEKIRYGIFPVSFCAFSPFTGIECFAVLMQMRNGYLEN
jgi:hypothetical protein